MSTICKVCGANVPEDAAVCPACGAPKAQAGPAEEPTQIFDGSAVEDAAREDAAREDKTEPEAKERRQPRQPQRSQSRQSGQRRTGTSRSGQSRRTGDRGREGQRPMKKRNAAVIGVLIGLCAALLLIAVVVGIMLFRLGFFEPMSDEELLGMATPSPAVTASPTPTPTPEPSPSPTPEPTPEPSPSPTPSPTPEPVQVDRFEVTGAGTINLYSRGETSKVSYIIEPADAASEIEWSSDNEIVALVNELGVIQARRGGSCTITGRAGNSEISVTVVCDFEVPDTVLDMNMEDITMSYEGQTVELAIDYELSQDYIDATVWESSDSAVAEVDQHGVVTARANGTAIITASINGYTASCIVRCVDVTGNKGYNSSTSEYAINYEDVTLTRKGEYFQLSLTSVLGREVPAFTWVTDDPSVATVDTKGVVTAVSDGTAYITAQIGEDQFRCIVRVNIS